MDMAQEPTNSIPLMQKAMNLVLLFIVLPLGVLTFFAIQTIIVVVVGHFVYQSPDVTVQDNYTIVTAKNIWAFVGGAFLLAFLIVGVDYHTRRLGHPNTTKILIGTLVIELVLIGISLIV